MEMIKVFLVVTVEYINGTRWRVRGRAYEDIKIGDTINLFNGEETIKFVIDSASSYGKEIYGLNRMMTGDIVLNGVNGETLLGIDMLYKMQKS